MRSFFVHKRLQILFAACLILGTREAAAHPLDLGYVRLSAQGDTVAFEMDLDALGAAELLGRKEEAAREATHPASIQGHARELAQATYLLAPLATELGACTFQGAHARRVKDIVQIRDTATCPSGSRVLRWSFPFMTGPGVAPSLQILVKAEIHGTEHVTTLDRAHTAFEFAGSDQQGSMSFGGFVWMGVEHIGAAPSEWQGDSGFQLPDGIDHILFLLGLILGGGTLLSLAGIATGFTIGHSITLALATLGIFQPPSALVEAVIALSIALVAVEAYSGKFKQHRWKMATGFGLVHGFGFANALTELDLKGGTLVKALFGYNLGVELGQVALVLVIAPVLLLLANKKPSWNPVVIRVSAAAIFVAGSFWFWQRAALA
jgi:hypothetical protein